MRIKTEVEVDAGGGAIARCWVHGIYTEQSLYDPGELPDVDVLSIAGGWPTDTLEQVEARAIEAACERTRRPA
jgi:hypothetical protein